MTKRLILIFTIVMILAGRAHSQDHLYSQFYNAPIYLNPALTGQFDGDIRVTALYRNQWTALGGDFSYINVSGDINLPQINSGLGISLNRGSEGAAYLRKTNISANYAFIVEGDDHTFSFGLQTGFTNRSVAVDKLVFGDQLDPFQGHIPGSVSGAEFLANNNKFYFDASAGANGIYRNFMLGVGVHHLNKPDESLTGTKSILPIRASLHASYLIDIIPAGYRNEGAQLIPSVVFYKQANVRSMSIGGQFKYRGVNAGVWFRSDGSNTGNDAVVFSFIFDIFNRRTNGEKFRLGISHDATTSRLNYSNTGGTSEIGIGYERYFPGSSRYGSNNGLRCYDFY